MLFSRKGGKRIWILVQLQIPSLAKERFLGENGEEGAVTTGPEDFYA